MIGRNEKTLLELMFITYGQAVCIVATNRGAVCFLEVKYGKI
jgi:hypothetical protein